MNIENTIQAIVSGKKKTPVSRGLLRILSECYRSGVFLRNAAYDLVIPEKRLMAPVISVGNIVAGGSGKTPFVHYLAERLTQKKVAVLSRGYKRKGKTTVVVKQDTSYTECGDEPLFLAQKLPSCTVIVDADRGFSGFLAQTVYGCNCILLDDGMQHRKLYRDYEIVVMNADDLYGGGFFLPRGFLRDSPSRLKKATLLIVEGVRDIDHYRDIEAELRKHTPAPVVAMQRHVKNQADVSSRKIGAFSGIANPHRFTKTLNTLGCQIVENLEKGDHEPFSAPEIEALCNRAKAKGATLLACTEKDEVKIPRDLAPSLPVVPIQIELKPFIGAEHLESFIQEVNQ